MDSHPGFDVAALDEWIGDRLPGGGVPLRAVRMGQGVRGGQHTLDRETFGEPLADRQGVQWMLADCARDLYIARLMVLHLAYKMEHGSTSAWRTRSPRTSSRTCCPRWWTPRCSCMARSATPWTPRWPPGTPRCGCSTWWTARTRCTGGGSSATCWPQCKSGTTAAAAGGDLF